MFLVDYVVGNVCKKSTFGACNIPKPLSPHKEMVGPIGKTLNRSESIG